MVLLVWLALAVWLLWDRYRLILGFALGDTDDNLRITQVRDWLQGQAWFDLRQHRLSPPAGFDIHWSRLVDLPIAGLILLFRPFVGGVDAERWAVALAPLLPLGLILVSLSLTIRRVVAPLAFWLAPALLITSGYVLGMVQPLRIDHHGWQLALLATMVAGLVDPARNRGAVVAAAATVLSLVIGLEMLPYLAIGTGIMGLRWVALGEPAADPLRRYAATLAAGSAVGFLLFASQANRAPVCDALSPVWLSATIGGGALFWLISHFGRLGWPGRLALAGAAALLLAGGFALAWPDCLGRPEGVSPELERLWLSNVREARPAWRLKPDLLYPMILLPVAGLIGAGLAIWRGRRSALVLDWIAIFLLVATAAGLLAWQTRAAPAAQLLAIPAAAALAWTVGRALLALPTLAMRAVALFVLFMIVSGVGLSGVLKLVPKDPPHPRTAAVNLANNRCPTLSALRPIARIRPPQTIFTFVDLGPRLLATTRHRAIAGPYHRNGDAIVAVHHAFDGTPDRARQIMKSRGATLLMVCPNMSESTIYRARSPKGFYAQLASGTRFGWLDPLPLPPNSPYRLWRIR